MKLQRDELFIDAKIVDRRMRQVHKIKHTELSKALKQLKDLASKYGL